MKTNFIYLVLIGLCFLTGCEKASNSEASETGKKMNSKLKLQLPHHCRKVKRLSENTRLFIQLSLH